MKHLGNYALLACVTLITLTLTACGGGGGGEVVRAASVQLEVDRHRIDSGERIQVTTRISDVDEQGLVIKFRYPSGLKFIEESSQKIAESREPGWRFVRKMAESVVDESTYLVFWFTRNAFGSENRGKLRFEVIGTGRIDNGLIEVDPDMYDPDKDVLKQFSPSQPNFTAEDVVSIEVVDG